MAAILQALLRLLVGVGASGGIILAFILGAHEYLLPRGLALAADVLGLMGVPAPDMPAIADWLATADLFVPVYFIFNLFVTWVAIRLGWFAYKFVKSWIPAVSSS